MNNEQAWNYAIGLIKVDGLEPTQEFKDMIEKEIAGEISMDELKYGLMIDIKGVNYDK